MPVLTLYSPNGGVGKTAAAVNLAYAAAQDDYRTLVWDLHDQGTVSRCFRIDPELSAGRRKLAGGKVDLDAEIKGSDFELLDVLPADPSLRRLGETLSEVKNAHRRFDEMVEPLRAAYDLVLVDAPPALDRLAETLFTISDALLVPIRPTPPSLQALDRLRGFLESKARFRAGVMPFFSLVDRRRALHRTVVNESEGMMKTVIPYASAVEQASVRRAPVGRFAPRSRACFAYDELWSEVRARLDAESLPD